MLFRRSQSTMEFMMLFGALIAIFVPIIFFFSMSGTEVVDEINDEKIKDLGNEFIQYSEEVFNEGLMNSRAMPISIPENIESMRTLSVGKDEHYLIIETFKNGQLINLTYPSDVPLVGNLATCIDKPDCAGNGEDCYECIFPKHDIMSGNKDYRFETIIAPFGYWENQTVLLLNFDCDCPPGQTCSADGDCIYACNDMTPVGDCSVVSPNYVCEMVSGAPSLIENCTVCSSCPSGESCFPNGLCAPACVFNGDLYANNICLAAPDQPKKCDTSTNSFYDDCDGCGCVTGDCNSTSFSGDGSCFDGCILNDQASLGLTPGETGVNFGECFFSTDSSYFCNDTTSNLVQNCTYCPGADAHQQCPNGYMCLDNGSCTQTCSDGTVVGECSFVKPYRCAAGGVLVEDCTSCGCLPGLNCDSGTQECEVNCESVAPEGSLGRQILEFIASDSTCSQPQDPNNLLNPQVPFQAGDTVYLKTVLTNEYTGPLNYHISSTDYYNVTGNYNRDYVFMGNHRRNLQRSIMPGCTLIERCLPHMTYDTYKEGSWAGRSYFRLNPSDAAVGANVQLSDEFFSFEIDDNPDYDFLNYSTNITLSPNTQFFQVGESRDYYYNFTNMNMNREFTGRFYTRYYNFSPGIPFSTTNNGYSYVSVIIPPGETVSYNLTHPGNLAPGRYSGHFRMVNDINHDMHRRWNVVKVNGAYHEFNPRLLAVDKLAYSPGETVHISTRIHNRGTLPITPSDCLYRFEIHDDSGNIIHNSGDMIVPLIHNVNIQQDYDYSFVYSGADVLDSFVMYIKFYYYDNNGIPQLMRKYRSNQLTISPNSYPDISSSCTEVQKQDPLQSNRLYIEKECNSGGDEVVFINSSINTQFRNVEGPVDYYWTGEKSGIEGYYIKGALNSDYNLSLWVI